MAHSPKGAVRGDGHYGTPEVMEFLEQQSCFYILGLPGNSRLKTLSTPWSKDVATRWRRGNREKLHRFYQTRYGARSWSKKRLVIARVEASRQGTDVRFIVTNLGGRSKHLYEKVYFARGKMENLLLGHAGMPCQTADQEAQTLHQIRPHFLPSLGGQPVPRSAGK